MTGNELVALMTRINLPALNKEQLCEIAAIEGKRFIEMLQAAAEHADAEAKIYAGCVTYAVHPSTRTTLRSLGLEVPLEHVIKTAVREGRRFFAAIKTVEKNGSSRLEAAEYLAGLFATTAIRNASAVVASKVSVERDVPTVAKAQVQSEAKKDFSNERAVRLYGGRAAFCFSQDKTRDRTGTGKGVSDVLRVEAALSVGARSYDWTEKIGIQVNRGEMFQLLAVLAGCHRGVALKGHGDKHDKFLLLENQDTQFFVKLGQKNRPVRAMPIPAHQGFEVASLITHQISLNEPSLDSRTIMYYVEKTAGMMPPYSSGGL